MQPPSKLKNGYFLLNEYIQSAKLMSFDTVESNKIIQ